jgi:phospholipase C
VAPENFSDHPGAPWYGAWYLSECLDILTKNPEVWRKTIFVLCYDENDGYFDHVPPFVPPNPDQPGTGKVSAGIDPSVEWVRMAQEDERQKTHPGSAKRSGPIGLGFRVPLVIASPWSRGGFVNSQVCDHTSIVQMLEKLLSHRTGKPIRETNISAWRRAICGDLSSVFRPYHGEKLELPKPVERDPFLGSIHQAQFRELPSGYRKLSAADQAQVRERKGLPEWMPRQEAGTRPACALPYELAVDGQLGEDRKSLVVRFAAGRERFGDRAVGAPFHVYAPTSVRAAAGGGVERGRCWSYAVTAGERLADLWPLADFPDGHYHLRVHGPNGFFRELRGSERDPVLAISMPGAEAGLKTALKLRNGGASAMTVEVEDLGYGHALRAVQVPAGGEVVVPLDLAGSHGWYDLGIRVAGVAGYVRRYAGHLETGGESQSDPLMGRASA